MHCEYYYVLILRCYSDVDLTKKKNCMKNNSADLMQITIICVCERVCLCATCILGAHIGAEIGFENIGIFELWILENRFYAKMASCYLFINAFRFLFERIL